MGSLTAPSHTSSPRERCAMALAARTPSQPRLITALECRGHRAMRAQKRRIRFGSCAPRPLGETLILVVATGLLLTPTRCGLNTQVTRNASDELAMEGASRFDLRAPLPCIDVRRRRQRRARVFSEQISDRFAHRRDRAAGSSFAIGAAMKPKHMYQRAAGLQLAARVAALGLGVRQSLERIARAASCASIFRCDDGARPARACKRLQADKEVR